MKIAKAKGLTVCSCNKFQFTVDGDIFYFIIKEEHPVSIVVTVSTTIMAK